MNDLIRNSLGIEGATERIDPDREVPGILSIHLKRYDFAFPYCKNRTVLDAACGVGYGAHHLAQTASCVIGIDNDPIAITYGQTRLNSSRVSFQAADVANTAFSDSHFDVVCSFETIEHLPNIPAYLKEMVRVLNPEGVYIVSTPQVSKTNHHPKNPYHRIEFSRKDFETLLHQYFGQVEIYGQRRRQSEVHYRLTQLLNAAGFRARFPKLGRLRNLVNHTLRTTTFNEMSLEDLMITKEKINRATELIAVCRIPKKSV